MYQVVSTIAVICIIHYSATGGQTQLHKHRTDTAEFVKTRKKNNWLLWNTNRKPQVGSRTHSGQRGRTASPPEVADRNGRGHIVSPSSGRSLLLAPIRVLAGVWHGVVWAIESRPLYGFLCYMPIGTKRTRDLCACCMLHAGGIPA